MKNAHGAGAIHARKHKHCVRIAIEIGSMKERENPSVAFFGSAWADVCYECDVMNVPGGLAVRFDYQADPRKVGLVIAGNSDQEFGVLVVVRQVTVDAIVVGGHLGDDSITTAFSRKTGLAVDGGKLAKLQIPPSELARIADFDIQGAYAEPPP